MVVPSQDRDVEVVQVGKEASDARAAWQQVLDADPSLPWAVPVLVDESGRDMLPTGEVTVRFAAEPSDEELEEFADRHGLTLRSRNEFVRAQAVFVPNDPRNSYLPDVYERLDAEPHVTRAWPNTRSRYERT
jgi:hypothetical protein